MAVDGEDTVATLRPSLLMLPAARLFRLELATGSTDSDTRENVIGVREHVDQAGNRRAPRQPARPAPRIRDTEVDLRERTISGAEDGPIDLVAALLDSPPWPGLSERERFQVLLGCLDAPFVRGKPATPFDLAASLDSMRKTVQQN